MKLLLQTVGVLSVVGGLAMFVMTISAGAYMPSVNLNLYKFVAFGWLLGGLVGAVISFGLAEIIGRLEQLTERQEPR